MLQVCLLEIGCDPIQYSDDIGDVKLDLFGDTRRNV
jgi:hypothetical protein